MQIEALKKQTNETAGRFRRLAEHIDEQVRPAFIRFGEAYYKAAEHEYLKYHDRLPGGHSTARLKKKRRDSLLSGEKLRVPI